MKILPLRTLPKRAMFIVNYHFLWPLKTVRETQKAFKRAQAKDGYVPTTILFYPEKPKTYHTLYKICGFLGWKVTNNIKEKSDIKIFFEDKTYKNNYPELQGENVINRNCTDISKQHVDEVFEKVFGYGISVDPKTYKGKCVKKSNINAVHDGEILECPIELTEDGYVYQKYVNTIQEDGRALDLRLHIFNGKSPLLLKRYKNSDDLFHITVDAEFVNPDDILSHEEKEKIQIFCKEIGLDYGEIDALRDNDDGRLYIVDANDTPAGPIDPLYNDQCSLRKWFLEVAKYTDKEFPRSTSA